MKLLSSVLIAAVSAQTGVGNSGVKLCGPCAPGNRCGSDDLWMKCDTSRKTPVCVCKPNWAPKGDDDLGCSALAGGENMNVDEQCLDGDDGGDDGTTMGPDITTPTKKPPIDLEAVLCGKCNGREGCGDDATYMYCHREYNMCMCMKGWAPNEDNTACTEKQNPDIKPVEFDFEMCKEVKPDVVDEVCPADACGENMECKMVQVNNIFKPKCKCKEGYEYNVIDNTCVPEDDGKCTKNTQCNMAANEKCDKADTGRCICKDGYMLGQDSSGDWVCMATCGKYQTIDPEDLYEAYEDADYEDKPSKPVKIPDYLRKYMKPQFCDPNATCVTQTVYGMEMQACKCNEGYEGNGCKCANKDDCQEYCDAKFPGSECDKTADGPSWAFRCRCPKGTNPLKYPNGQPCCVARPECESHEECEAMGSAYCSSDGEVRTCKCKDGLYMNKKQMCVDPNDPQDEEEYEDEENDDGPDVISDPCAGFKCERNAHCVVDKYREPHCKCNDGFEGKEGRNCIKKVDNPQCEPNYGTCLGDGSAAPYVVKPDFMVKAGAPCGDRSMHTVCGEDSCCHCDKYWSDADGKVKTGCEARENICDQQNICHERAKCVDLSEIANEYEYEEDKPKPYRMTMDEKPNEKPIDLPDLGFKCVCQPPLVGNGIGPQGCHKPEEEQVNECDALRKPCGSNSDCHDKPDGYKCVCHEGYKSKTRDGKNCYKPVEQVDPIEEGRCDGFCPYSKQDKGTCHLRTLGFHEKLYKLKVMSGEASLVMRPGVVMTVATKRLGWPLGRSKYSAFLEWDQSKCGSALLNGMASGDIDVGIFDYSSPDGKSLYRVDGILPYLTKTKGGSKAVSGLVVQFTKTHKTLGDLSGNADDMEMMQFLKELKDGSFQLKPDFDVFEVALLGKSVSPEVMGKTKFESCFRSGPPFKMTLWDEREEVSETDTMEDREKLVPLNGDHTKCFVYKKYEDKPIGEMVCKEPLVVDGEKVKDKPTFNEMLQQGDDVACTEE